MLQSSAQVTSPLGSSKNLSESKLHLTHFFTLCSVSTFCKSPLGGLKSYSKNVRVQEVIGVLIFPPLV